jgi:hypothetical protein
MLHSLRPEHFVAGKHLGTPWQCPECGSHFIYGNGVMSLAHYRETETGEIRQGSRASVPPHVCFVRPTMLALMQRAPASCRRQHYEEPSAN